MNASFQRRRTVARNTCTSGMRMALDCARNVYEAVDRRMPEAAALANWLRQSAAAFGLPDTAIPDDDTPRRSRRRGVPMSDWRKIGSALTSAEAAIPDNANATAERWIEAIAGTLALDPLEARMLALALHYKLDQRVERLFDAISECRGLITRFHRDSGLIALLLHLPTAEIEMRLTGDAKLRASGLLRVDQHGELCVLEHLVSLIRQDVAPAIDFYDQLLGAIAVDPLPWKSFAHLGREAEVVASVLQAALAGRESGINVLLYGPPGTGKTSFAATLAARTGARLRPVAEADEEGGEPARLRRLKIGFGCLHIGFEGRPLVLSILQYLFRNRTAWERLLVANNIVAHFVEQSCLRENFLARLLARREKRANRAYRARQLAPVLAERRRGALRIKTDEQISLIHMFGFLVIDLSDHPRCVGIDGDEIAGDEGVVGSHPEPVIGSPFCDIG